jgi:NADH-quinone oxidoreductase subunit A
MSALLAVLILGFIILCFGIFLVWGSGKLGPKRNPTPAKMMPYECGIPGQETKDSKISVKFYLTAILFIIFDIEIIFMYPWAVTFVDFIKQGLGAYVLGGMGIFILLFVIGLVWEVKSKALDWN